MTRICLVLCYLGPLPRYFDTFLGTCERNEDIDFLIASDRPAPPGLGPNIHWLPTTMERLHERFSATLGFPAALEGGYKLCDYKPLFGHAFEDELEEYDYWGFTDPDLVWGHIRSFATEERLARHDVLSFRGRGFISGPCTLFRNVPALNMLYTRSPSVDRVFTMPKTTAFTETNGRWDEQPPIEELVRAGEIVSFTDVVRDGVIRGDVRWFDEDEIVERDPAVCTYSFLWNAGHLYQLSEEGQSIGGPGGREVLFYHYVSAKQSPFFYIPDRRTLPPRFFITDHGAFAPEEDSWFSRADYERRRLQHGTPRYVSRLWHRIRAKLRRGARAVRS